MGRGAANTKQKVNFQWRPCKYPFFFLFLFYLFSYCTALNAMVENAINVLVQRRRTLEVWEWLVRLEKWTPPLLFFLFIISSIPIFTAHYFPLLSLNLCHLLGQVCHKIKCSLWHFPLMVTPFSGLFVLNIFSDMIFVVNNIYKYKWNHISELSTKFMARIFL